MRFLSMLTMCAVCFGAGCATNRPDTGGFASVDSVTVNAGFEETWQATKAVLREMELEVYTRDTAGEFVAFSPMERQFHVLTPRRSKFTVRVEELGAESTSVSVEYVEQVYGVTPLTYPDWHDRESVDNSTAVAILESVRNRLG